MRIRRARTAGPEPVCRVLEVRQEQRVDRLRRRVDQVAAPVAVAGIDEGAVRREVRVLLNVRGVPGHGVSAPLLGGLPVFRGNLSTDQPGPARRRGLSAPTKPI